MFANSRSRGRVQKVFNEPTRTKQSFRDECDVNNIMYKFGAARILGHYGQFKGEYGDFLDVQDYQTSMNQIIQAQDMFMSLPSKLRARFENDPSQFLAFVSNPDNRDEMKSLGLLKPQVQVQNSEPVKDLEGIQNVPD